MTVSVVIPIYNGERDVDGLIAALACQDFSASDTEFMVIDNGSKDDTVKRLESAVGRCPAVRVKVLAETKIQGSYAARNRGIRESRGEILAFTDADCRPSPVWVSELVRAFDDPETGIVGGAIGSVPGNSWIERHSARRDMLSQANTLRHPFRPYVQTANMGVRRAVFLATGLFRPYLTTGGDADLCWRATEAGWKIAVADRAVTLHRHRDSLAGLREQFGRYGRANQYLAQLHGFKAEWIPPTPAERAKDLWKRFVPAAKTLLRLGSAHELADLWLDECRLRWSLQGMNAARLPDQATFIPQMVESSKAGMAQ